MYIIVRISKRKEKEKAIFFHICCNNKMSINLEALCGLQQDKDHVNEQLTDPRKPKQTMRVKKGIM